MTRSVPSRGQIEALIRAVGTEPTPRAALTLAPALGLAEPVAVLAGAFDPPTRAHLALARAALRAGAATLLFSIAARTVGKEERTRAPLPLRLAMLCRLAHRRPRWGVVVCNRGLYLEQAQALAGLGIRQPRFVIGFDKLAQLFDPRYYRDREAALDALFAAASFLVAPRDGGGAAELEAFMQRQEQRRYAAGVQPLRLTPLEARLAAGVSSTRVRELLARGGRWQEFVPREARRLVERSGAYVASGRSDSSAASR